MKFDGRAATVKSRKLHTQRFPELEFVFVLLGKPKEDFFMPIYTKTGDKGETGLYSGIRISKASPRIEAIGTVDELNSTIGFAISQIRNSESEIRKELVKIQSDLFEVGAALANPNQKIDLSKRTKEFENLIDKMTKELPPLFNFILPGGGVGGSSLHIARTITRRAERKMVSLSSKEKVQSDIIVYINRLSDLFLTMSRFINMKENQKETIWTGRAK